MAKTIMLVCSAGMSTSLLVTKMQKQQKIVAWKQTSLQYRLLKQIQTWKIKGECFTFRSTSSFHERAI